VEGMTRPANMPRWSTYTGKGLGRGGGTWEDMDMNERWMEKVNDLDVIDLVETFFANLGLA